MTSVQGRRHSNDAGVAAPSAAVRRRANELVLENLPISLVGAVFTGAAFPFAVRDVAAPNRLAAWAVAVAVPALLRVALVVIGRRARSNEESERWLTWVTCAYAFSSVVWGMSPMLSPDPEPKLVYVSMLFVLAISAVAVPTFGSRRRLAVAQLVPMWLMLAVRFVDIGQVTLAVCGMVMLAFSIRFNAEVRSTLWEALTLREQAELLSAELQASETLMRHQALHDPLTGLLNRAGLITHLDGGTATGSVAILFVDLDRFKLVNDRAGHAAGDDVLRTVADRLSRTCRSSDVLARLGGDEFVLVMASPLPEAELVALAERVISLIEEPVPGVSDSAQLSASVGVATAPNGATSAMLIGLADLAMYGAKNAGGAQVRVFGPELAEAATQRADLDTGLRNALAQGEIEFWGQPIHGTDSTREVHVELLARWQRPGHGVVPPDSFIPFAEETGLVNDIGRQAIDCAVRLLDDWESRCAEPPLTVAVNVSSGHLTSTLIEDVRSRIEGLGRPEGLVLELTETRDADHAEAIAAMWELRALGVGLAIDDFGTGYSSLGYLQHLPATTLKIDQTLVADICTDRRQRRLVEVTATIAEEFDLLVVAEGVETGEQLALLRRMGIHWAQGYHLDRPMPPEALHTWLTERRSEAALLQAQ